MALPDGLEDKLSKIASIIDAAINRFNQNIDNEQRRLYKQLLQHINKLKLDNAGKVRITGENKRILAQLLNDFRKIHRRAGYRTAVDEYAKALRAVSLEINLYYAGLIAGLNTNKILYTTVLEAGIKRITRELNAGKISQDVVDEVSKALKPDKRTGLISKGELKARLDNLVLTKGETIGILRRSTGQIAHDLLYAQARLYERTLSEDLGFEWFLYAGSAIRTTRPFCRERHNKFFHKKEVLSWNSLDWQGKKTAKYGKVDIFVDCGGFNCRHQLSAVAQSFVPQIAIDRAKRLGYIK